MRKLDREAAASGDQLPDLTESPERDGTVQTGVVSQAESFGDPGRAERARTELDWIAAELSRAVGIGS